MPLLATVVTFHLLQLLIQLLKPCLVPLALGAARATSVRSELALAFYSAMTEMMRRVKLFSFDSMKGYTSARDVVLSMIVSRISTIAVAYLDRPSDRIAVSLLHVTPIQRVTSFFANGAEIALLFQAEPRGWLR